MVSDSLGQRQELPQLALVRHVPKAHQTAEKLEQKSEQSLGVNKVSRKVSVSAWNRKHCRSLGSTSVTWEHLALFCVSQGTWQVHRSSFRIGELESRICS